MSKSGGKRYDDPPTFKSAQWFLRYCVICNMSMTSCFGPVLMLLGVNIAGDGQLWKILGASFAEITEICYAVQMNELSWWKIAS